MKSLSFQRGVARVAAPLTYWVLWFWMRVIQGYKIDQLQKVRAEFDRIQKETGGPFLICPNHLTLIDSLIAVWALGSLPQYLRSPGMMAWNLPEKKNFYNNLMLRWMCYLGKCVPVIRGGGAEQTRKTLDQVNWLLNEKESVMIFPEGGRSRTGRIDHENFAYGVGQIIQANPQARVICMYLRGHTQENYTSLPHRGDRFEAEIQLINPRTESVGLRGARDLATQIIHTLQSMEKKYFENKASTKTNQAEITSGSVFGH